MVMAVAIPLVAVFLYSTAPANAPISGALAVRRAADWTDYDNGDGTHTMTIGRSNVWNGSEWRPPEEFSSIVKMSYSNGTITVKTPYWSKSYGLEVGISGKAYRLGDREFTHSMNVRDLSGGLEYDIRVAGITTAVANGLEYVRWVGLNETGDRRNIEESFDTLILQGFTVSKNKANVTVTGLSGKVSGGVLLLDPEMKLNVGNVTDDTFVRSGASTTEFGAGQYLNIFSSGGAFNSIMLKFNLISLPAGIIVTNASVTMTIRNNLLDAGEQYATKSYHIYDRRGYNITNLEWREGNTVSALSCLPTGTASVAPEVRYNWRPDNSTTVLLVQERMNTTASDNNTIKTGWNYGTNITWVVANAVTRSVALGLNNVSLYINTTPGAGSPGTADCVNFHSSENATVNIRPYLNVTYIWQKARFGPNTTNSTLAGAPINHSVNVTVCSNCTRYGFIFEFCDGSLDGSACRGAGWVNDTFLAFAPTQTWVNVSKVINATVGAAMGWRVYVNDSGNGNQWNASDIFSYTATAPVVSTCTYGGVGNWLVACSDNCIITSAVNVIGNISISGTGTFRTTVNIGYYNKTTIIGTSATNRCKVTCAGGCFKKYVGT